MVQNVDEIARKLREGSLVPSGRPRPAVIRGLRGYVAKPGEALPGPFVIVSARRSDDPRGDGDTWEIEIVPLTEPTASN
jgi:hypothetical protein